MLISFLVDGGIHRTVAVLRNYKRVKLLPSCLSYSHVNILFSYSSRIIFSTSLLAMSSVPSIFVTGITGMPRMFYS